MQTGKQFWCYAAIVLNLALKDYKYGYNKKYFCKIKVFYDGTFMNLWLDIILQYVLSVKHINIQWYVVCSTLVKGNFSFSCCCFHTISTHAELTTLQFGLNYNRELQYTILRGSSTIKIDSISYLKLRYLNKHVISKCLSTNLFDTFRAIFYCKPNFYKTMHLINFHLDEINKNEIPFL